MRAAAGFSHPAPFGVRDILHRGGGDDGPVQLDVLGGALVILVRRRFFIIPQTIDAVSGAVIGFSVAHTRANMEAT